MNILWQKHSGKPLCCGKNYEISTTRKGERKLKGPSRNKGTDALNFYGKPNATITKILILKNIGDSQKFWKISEKI